MTNSAERLRALLSGPGRWHSLEHLEETGSTNDVALERTRQGTPPGLVVMADRQTRGRGRAGRTWVDHPGGSLLVSVTIPPPAQVTLVPLAAGLACADALRRQGVHVGLKWPNDVLADGHKLAGVLSEHHGDVVVVGVGIDLDWRGVDRVGEQAEWTSVAEETGVDVDRWDVLTDLLRSLDLWVRDLDGDPARLLGQYQDACNTLGTLVEVTTPAGDVVVGRAIGLDRTGALGVETENGSVAVTAGDVTHL